MQQCLNFHNQSRGECQQKKGQEPGMQSMGSERFGPQDSKAKPGAHKYGLLARHNR